MISLFMYAGPVYPRTASSRNWASVVFASGSITRDVWLRWSARLAVLYTGDGYLNSTGRFDALTNYLTKTRISRVSCFQVMHHGAQGNWHEGIAKKVSPDISVFSSDPDHKGFNHPHGCVARDFLKYTPVQVDKTEGLKILMRQYS